MGNIMDQSAILLITVKEAGGRFNVAMGPGSADAWRSVTSEGGKIKTWWTGTSIAIGVGIHIIITLFTDRVRELIMVQPCRYFNSAKAPSLWPRSW